MIHKRLAVQTLGLLVEVEGVSFEKRLVTFLPLLSECLVIHELIEQEEEEEDEVDNDIHEQDNDIHGEEHAIIMETDVAAESGGEGTPMEELQETGGKQHPQRPSEAMMDHLLFSALSNLEKICTKCTVLRVPTYCVQMNELWGM